MTFSVDVSPLGRVRAKVRVRGVVSPAEWLDLDPSVIPVPLRLLCPEGMVRVPEVVRVRGNEGEWDADGGTLSLGFRGEGLHAEVGYSFTDSTIMMFADRGMNSVSAGEARDVLRSCLETYVVVDRQLPLGIGDYSGLEGGVGLSGREGVGFPWMVAVDERHVALLGALPQVPVESVGAPDGEWLLVSPMVWSESGELRDIGSQEQWDAFQLWLDPCRSPQVRPPGPRLLSGEFVRPRQIPEVLWNRYLQGPA